MKQVLLALALGMLGACATIPSDAPPFRPAADAPAGMANLYVYRSGAYPYLRGITLTIDGREYATFAEGAYVVVPVGMGSHEMRVSWPLDVLIPPLRIPIEIPDEGPYYLKITSHPEGLGAVVVEVLPLPRTVAEQEMRRCCRLIPIRNAD